MERMCLLAAHVIPTLQVVFGVCQMRWGCEHTVGWCSVDAYGSMLAHSMAYAAWDVSSESPEAGSRAVSCCFVDEEEVILQLLESEMPICP